MKITVCDISGMGGREYGGYEWGCQILALRGQRWLQRQQKSEAQMPSYLEAENVIGIAFPNNEQARAMDTFMLDHPVLRERGVTGAMHQYALAHARKLHELGREGYLAECRKCRPNDDFYDFEEAEAFPDLESVTPSTSHGGSHERRDDG